MNGRRYFVMFQKILIALSFIFNPLPNWARAFIWSLTGPFGGFIALGIRYSLLKSAALKVGNNTYVGEYVLIRSPESISIGSNVSIHPYTYIDSKGGLEIGDNVSIAHSVSIVSTSHTWDDLSVPIKYNPVLSLPIKIGNNVWIGCGVRILYGVTIGDRSIVAAGSVVRHDVPSGTVVAGVPAQIVKSISPRGES